LKKELLAHFAVVVDGERPGTFKAVPYNESYKDDMQMVAGELDIFSASTLEDSVHL